MSVVAVPTPAVTKRRIPWTLAIILSVAALGLFWLANALRTGPRDPALAGEFYTVAPIDMDVTISKDGELQAVTNVDINNPVEGQVTILEIAKEGEFVKKGEVVVRIDSTDLQQKIENAQLDLQKAQADLTASQEAKEIQESTNSANLESAQVDLTLARLDLLQYTDGDYPAALKKAQIAVDMAQTTLKNKEEELSQTKQLFGKGFVTAAEVKTSELSVLSASNDLEQKQSDLFVLEKYKREKDLAEKKSEVAQQEKRLARVQRENNSQLMQRMADLQAKQQMLALRKQQYEHMQEQFAACTIKAPSDGMVVYSSSSGGWGHRDTPISAGVNVRQNELLIRLPDTSSMKVVCKINESLVGRLKVDPNNPMRAAVQLPGRSEWYAGWVSNISVLADSSQRWWSPDSRDYPVDVTLEQTPPGLKPGMGAQVRIFIERLRQVTAVPLSAVYAAGRDNYVFVIENGAVRPRKVSLGDVNESFAAVKDGITRGDRVLVLQAGQGRDLLDKAGIKVQDDDANLPPDKRQRSGPGPAKKEGGRGERRQRNEGPPTQPATMPAEPPRPPGPR